jgi:protein gp37
MTRDVFPLPVAAHVRPAGALAARARKVKERCAALQTGDRNNFQLAKELGEELLAAKLDCVTEGCGWLAWLKDEAGIPQERASEYMRLAKESRSGGLLADSANVGFSEGLRIIRAAAAKGRDDGGEEPAEEGAGYEDAQEPPEGEDEGNECEEAAEVGNGDDEATSQDAPTEEDGCEGDNEPEPGYITLGRWEEAGEELRRTVLRVRGDAKFNAQGANENIEWALWSWNPVTGCLHNCPYCYARDIADRFYEQKFAPSLWPGRLAAPAKTPFPAAKIAAALAEKTPEGDVRAIGLGNVFTCSMADLFGRWVPSVWVEAVLDAVRAAPRWTFLFLTKFPVRMAEFDFPDNVWVGTTVDCQARVKNAEKAFRRVKARVKWLSCEPLIEPLVFQDLAAFHWLVLGGSSRSTQTPEWHPPRSWVNALEAQAAAAGVKVYEKSNLLDRVRQYPGVESAGPTQAPPELRYLPTDGSLPAAT